MFLASCHACELEMDFVDPHGLAVRFLTYGGKGPINHLSVKAPEHRQAATLDSAAVLDGEFPWRHGHRGRKLDPPGGAEDGSLVDPTSARMEFVSRLAMTLVAVSVVVAACGSGARTEIRTDNGGLLDCTSETVEYFHMDYGPDAQGATTAANALLVLVPDRGRPPGSPQVETERVEAVTFVFTDGDQNRLGRASVIRLTNGWIVKWTERCD